MKSTGIVRKIDGLGRIVLPKELRRTMALEENDPMEIFVDGESIIIRKYAPACIFCNSADDIHAYGNRYICRSCLSKLQKLPIK